MDPGVAVGTVRAWRALFLGGLLLVAGCSDQPGAPVEFDDFGSAVAADGPVYFGVPLCVTDGPAQVTIDSVEALEVTGTDTPLDLRIAWPDGPTFDRVTAGRGPVPAAYVPAESASGEVGTCGPNRLGYGALAVVLPESAHPVVVEDLEVTYEVDDQSFTERVDVTLTQCPAGTRPGDEPGECPRPRAAG